MTTDPDADISARTRAVDSILRVASLQREFTVADIVAHSEVLEDSHRKTVKRALKELATLGRVSRRRSGSDTWHSEILPPKPEPLTVEQLPTPSGDLSILHVFADRGVESEALDAYGDVVRVSINAKANDASEAIKADGMYMPIAPDVTFDLGVLHPPCGKYSPLTNISGNQDDWPDLIPLAREIATDYCDHYVIENKPEAPLEDATTLSGKMFGLPIQYKRAFETSFPVEQPPETALETEVSPYFYSDRSKSWWAGVKGYPVEYPKGHLAKNCVPAAYIHHLMRAYFRETNRLDADHARSNHNDVQPRRLAADD